MKKIDTERQTAIEDLQKVIRPGDSIYTIIRHVSRSGMYRVIDLYRMVDNVPLRISWTAAKAMGDRYDRKHEGIGVSGCGMDMCWNTVYNLGRVLFPKGFKLGKGKTGRNGDKSGFDNDGGYALVARSL